MGLNRDDISSLSRRAWMFFSKLLRKISSFSLYRFFINYQSTPFNASMHEVQFRIDTDGHRRPKPINLGLQSVPCDWHALRTETQYACSRSQRKQCELLDTCRVGLVNRRSHIVVSSKIMLFRIGITITHCSIGTPRS
jgi:hypothetical protein